jgi:hypothetical protein
VIGFDDIDNELHEGRWREELAVVVRLLHRKLGKKVFVVRPKTSPLACLIRSLLNSRIRSSSTFGSKIP